MKSNLINMEYKWKGEDSNVEDYTYECESRGECDDTHEYYIQVIYREV